MWYRLCFFFFFVKQKTAYEMRISDWSSDVCSSDLRRAFKSDLVALLAQLRKALVKIHTKHDVVIAGTALFQHLREYRAIAFHGLDEFDQKTSSEAERHLDGQDSRFAPVTMPFFEAHFDDIERPRPPDRRPMLYGLIHVISVMANHYTRSGGLYTKKNK